MYRLTVIESSRIHENVCKLPSHLNSLSRTSFVLTFVVTAGSSSHQKWMDLSPTSLPETVIRFAAAAAVDDSDASPSFAAGYFAAEPTCRVCKRCLCIEKDLGSMSLAGSRSWAMSLVWHFVVRKMNLHSSYPACSMYSCQSWGIQLLSAAPRFALRELEPIGYLSNC